MTQLTQNTTNLQSILDAVNALPDAGPSVSGEIAITANGTFDVKKYATANVNVAPVLLWTNASPTSAFAAQTINVGGNYNGYIVELRYSASGTVVTGKNFVTVGIQQWCAISGSSTALNWVAQRVVTPSTNSITFGSGQSSDSLCIPTRIWGVKFTIS